MTQFLKTVKTSAGTRRSSYLTFSCPAVIIMGDEDPDYADPRAEAEAIVAAMPAGLGTVVMLQRGGHCNHAQSLDEVTHHIGVRGSEFIASALLLRSPSALRVDGEVSPCRRAHAGADL